MVEIDARVEIQEEIDGTVMAVIKLKMPAKYLDGFKLDSYSFFNY